MALNRSDVDYIDDDDSAARAYLELKHELGKPGLPSGRHTEAKAALNKLERTFPNASKRAAEASDDDLGGLHAGLKRTRDTHRRQRGVSSGQARNARRRQQRAGGGSSGAKKPASKKSPPSTPRRPSSSGRRARGRAAGRRAWRETGIPQGTWSISSLVLQALGVTIALSVGFLLLENAETSRRGQSAIELLSEGLSEALHVVIAPVDPLGRANP